MVVDHWESEDVIITIEEEGLDTVRNISTKISNISVSGGSQSLTEIFTFGNGTVNFTPRREKYEVSLDLIFSDSRFAQYAFGSGAFVSGKEFRSSDSVKRNRIIIWFVPLASQIKSGTVVVPPVSGEMMRWIFTDCKAVTFDREFSADEVLRGTLTFEFSATDENGYANFFDEYTAAQGTTTLTVLNTTAHKGTLTWTTTTTKAWTGSYRT